MLNVHHKPIKAFRLDGVIGDESSIQRLRAEYIRLVTTEMRLAGYVPRLDIDPDFTIEYNVKLESFSFALSLYGVYVGKKKSEWITGVDGTRVIHTPKNKSKESLLEQGSQLREK